MVWYALVRFEDPVDYPDYPKEGYPIAIHALKSWFDNMVDGKRYKVVQVESKVNA